MKDEIIEEIHRVREELAEKYDFNVRAMLEDLQRKQPRGEREYVTFAPKKLKKKISAPNNEIKKAA
jgi:polyhydroxyalkanoate synthesis regulator phasin